MTFVRVAFAIAALIYVAAFAVGNKQGVSVDLVFVELREMPLALVVLASVAIGASLASLALAWPFMQGRARERRTTRKIEELEREIHGLRTLPLVADDASSRQRPGL